MGKPPNAILAILLLFAGFGLPDSAQSPPPAQPAAPSPPAAQTAETLTQPFTSTDGRFSTFFPGPPAQTSQLIQLKNGETTTLYEFSASTGTNGASYIVIYNDYPPDAVAAGPQVLLERTESGAVAGKTLLTDQVIDLRGVPGRAYTAIDSNGYQYSVHEFLAGTRLYQLIVATAKGATATQINQFMNSFIIL